MNLRLQRDREAQAAQRARLTSLMREREARAAQRARLESLMRQTQRHLRAGAAPEARNLSGG